MKKTRFVAAGLLSAAMAVVPVVGAFAAKSTDTHTDTLSIQLNPTCTIDDDATHPGASGQVGSWGSGATANTLSAVIAADTQVTLGSTTLNLVCNDTSGWSLTVQANDLVGGTNPAEKFVNGTIPGAFTDGASGVYSFTANIGTDTDMTITDGGANSGVTSNTATGAGKTVTYTYTAKANSKTMSAQTYTGTVVYTLSSNADVAAVGGGA